jgi:hypothetical protein
VDAYREVLGMEPDCQEARLGVQEIEKKRRTKRCCTII